MRGDGSPEPKALVSSIQAESSHDTHPAPQQPAPVALGDALMEFIERVGNVRIQRVRKGFNGPTRWDVEYGYEDKEVHGRTLRDAINAAARAHAKEGQSHE